MSPKAKIFALSKGFRGRRENCYSFAIRAVHKALQRQYISRRLKKRTMRTLQIERINNGCREHNIDYGDFTHQINQEHIYLNRKVLSEFATHEPRTFMALSQLAKERQRDGLLAALD